MTACHYCGAEVRQKQGAINRALREGKPIYCDRKCAGLARRQDRTAEELKEAKRLYDIEYRKRNAELLKAKKARYFQRTYDPAKAAVERKQRMAKHVEYCRQPAYRRYKSAYDRRRRANLMFGEFADCYLTLQEMERELDKRATRYEVYLSNGTLNKAQRRRRAL